MAEKPLEIPSDKEILRILTDEEQWVFEQGKHTESPTPVPEYIEDCDQEVKMIQNHLVGTYIMKDPFGTDHKARRAYFRKTGFSAFQSKYSKLKGNNLMGAILCMRTIVKMTKREFSEISSKLNELFDSKTVMKINEYNHMSIEEKVTFAHELDEILFRFLEVLTTPLPELSS